MAERWGWKSRPPAGAAQSRRGPCGPLASEPVPLALRVPPRRLLNRMWSRRSRPDSGGAVACAPRSPASARKARSAPSIRTVTVPRGRASAPANRSVSTARLRASPLTRTHTHVAHICTHTHAQHLGTKPARADTLPPAPEVQGQKRSGKGQGLVCGSTDRRHGLSRAHLHGLTLKSHKEHKP